MDLQNLRDWLSKTKSSFWDGKFQEARDFFSTINPATEELLSQIGLASAEDVDRAVGSARAAFEGGGWRRQPRKLKARVLRQIGDALQKHSERLALLETLDTGKPIQESLEGDIPRAASNFHFFSELLMTPSYEKFLQEKVQHFAVREPLGVAALITPWNLPLYLETWKIAPCLAMGNSVILKPSELTPLTASYLFELLQELDLPPGVVNLLHGFGSGSTGAFLCRHPGIDAISFTGETTTGKAIAATAASNLTRLSFELGGKGASIIFGDAPKDSVSVCLRAAFRNQGEICLASPRVYVERSKYDSFVEEFVSRAQQIRVGDPLDPETQMGALISKDHYEKVTGYLKKVEPPGRILCGGTRPENLEKGFFLKPTVVVDLDERHPMTVEEIFGPVVSLYPFDSEKDVIDKVNGTPYGLSASIWTADSARAKRVGSALQMGLVWVNSWFVRDLRVPFGGQKKSGVGREGGLHSFDFFSQWKSLAVPFEMGEGFWDGDE